MTKQEFALFAAALKTYYPREQLLPNSQAMDLWFAQLQDIPFKLAETALNKWVATNKWSPSIAEIRETSLNIQQGDLPTWGDGWEQVCYAIRHFGYYNQAGAMNYLTGITKEAVKRMGFRNLCLSENEAADRANFRMIFETLANRQKMDAQLPKYLTKLIDEIQSGDPQRLELKE